jgi:putative flippase GtrA
MDRKVRNQATIRQLFRFGGVGILATLAHVLTAIAAEALLPLSHQAANLTGFCAGVLVSYTGHARFTFNAPVRSTAQILRFMVLAPLSLATSSATVWLTTGKLGFSFPAAMAAVAVVVPMVTYLAMRFWVFARPTAHKDPRNGQT